MFEEGDDELNTVYGKGYVAGYVFCDDKKKK
jgi:hypothetical protein